VFGGERVKLLDFGLAKLLTTEVRRTSEGAILGTPLYMSPEQWQGGHRLGPKSDVYALGSLFFEMLTGQPPFFGSSPSELMYQHVNRRPPLLSDLALDVPQRLDGLLAVMLAKEPVTRPHMEDVTAVLSTLREEAGLRGPLQLLEATPLAVSATASEGLSDTLGAEPREPLPVAKVEAPPDPPPPAASTTPAVALQQSSQTSPKTKPTPTGTAVIAVGSSAHRISRDAVRPISGLTPVTPTAAARSSSLSAISVSVAPPPSRRLLWRLVTVGLVGVIVLTAISLAVLRHRPVQPQSAAKPPITTPSEAVQNPSVPVATPTTTGVGRATPVASGASVAPNNPPESAESSRKASKRKRRSSSKQKDSADSKGDDPMTVFREH
jgi:serine/threonine protein kinase